MQLRTFSQNSEIRPNWRKAEMPPEFLDTLITKKAVSVQLIKQPAKQINARKAKELPEKLEFVKEDLVKAVEDNLENSMKNCEKFLLTLNKKHTVSRITLRLCSIGKFDAIYFIPSKDFFSDEFKKMYGKAAAFSEEIKTDKYNLNISFMPIVKNINKEMLLNDGYFFTYEK